MSNIGNRIGDFCDSLWANAVPAPRSHASHGACSLRPSGFYRLSHNDNSTREAGGANNAPASNQ